MEWVFRKAGLDMLELLVQTRMMVLRAANVLNANADLGDIEQESGNYYEQSLSSGNHVAYLVYEEEALVGTGGISFYQVMPTCDNPTGRKAYIMNMYTDPSYRRRGLARQMLEQLLGEARERGVDFITLEATKMGRPLYESCGFVPMGSEMRYMPITEKSKDAHAT